MKEYVMSLKEKTTQPKFSYFQIAHKYRKNIKYYFWRFQYMYMIIRM